MSESVVEVHELSRQFGKTRALDGVSLQLQRGLVYGLVGANGQGKTTLIRHLLGLLRAKEGSVRVFGLDPVKHPVEVLQRIGYLSEERDLPEWMRIHELLRYTAAYHPGWDQSYALELLDAFGLDGTKTIKQLSKGMRAQAGLIAAIAHRPELLVLDEPSTGLDPIVRRDILNALVRTVADEGRTALFSSHLLDEVEQMSDYVFIIDAGRIALEGRLHDICDQHSTLNVRFDSAPRSVPSIEGVVAVEQREGMWQFVCDGGKSAVHARLQAIGGEVTQSRNATLQEIFVARLGRDRLSEETY